jgi:hypothetical protein
MSTILTHISGNGIINAFWVILLRDGGMNISHRKVSSGLHAPSRETISVGDIVVIKNESVPRVFWKLAKVEELMKNDDGITA